MQIRLGNRQDESSINQLVFAVMKEFDLTVEPDRTESDLKNIEANYFGHDGVFLIAEEEGKLIGIAGARRSNDCVLELVRMAVDKDWRGKGIARQLISTVLSFANDLGYKQIVVEPARQYRGGMDFLMRFGFTSDVSEDAQKPWYYRVNHQN
jgi:predicted N-acetyltransferase YhbS